MCISKTSKIIHPSPELGKHLDIKDIDCFKPKIRYIALDSKVLVIARTRIEGTWAAYIGAVDGIRHEEEWEKVAACGTKISKDLAKLLFPDFADISYAW